MNVADFIAKGEQRYSRNFMMPESEMIRCSAGQ